jgi:hypothetical protein
MFKSKFELILERTVVVFYKKAEVLYIIVFFLKGKVRAIKYIN